jgi:hypothetical protein
MIYFNSQRVIMAAVRGKQERQQQQQQQKQKVNNELKEELLEGIKIDVEGYEIEKVKAGLYSYQFLQELCIWLDSTLSINCANFGHQH